MKSPTHLNALRAFEATARLGSFKAASDEIGVTPEAVGQLVRTLEAYIDIQLFHRNRGGKRLAVTQDALAVLPSLSEAIRNLMGITDKLKNLSRTGVLTLSSPPSVAAKWLVPLLPAFLSEEPNVDVRLDMTDRVLDLSAGEADVVIRYGEGDWPELNVIELASDEKLFPVCCPDFLKAHPEIVELPGLLKQTLIRDVTMSNPRYPGWREWLHQAGHVEFDSAHFLEVNASLAAIEMAKLCQGVALVREHLVRSEIADGVLINLYPDCVVSTHWNYYILTIKKPKEQVVAFAQWLKENLSRQL